jgi:ABC-type spermidine/putrescine transport system permease subunit II
MTRLLPKRYAAAPQRSPFARFSPFLLLSPALALSAALFIGPLIQALITSLGAGRPSLAAYTAVLSSPGFRADFAFTIALGLGTVAGCTLIALPLALLLRWPFRGRRLAWLVALVPFVVPHIIAAYALRLTLSPASPLLFWLPQSGRDGMALVNAWPGLLIALIWKHFPLLLLSLSAALQQLPPGVEEAARDLGAGAWRRLRTIVLPLIGPGWAAGATLVLILSMSQFTISLIIYGGQRLTTVPIDIYFETFSSRRPEVAAALGLLLLLVTLVLAASAGWLGRRAGTDAPSGTRSAAPPEAIVTPGGRLAAGLLLAGLAIFVLAPVLSLVLTSFSSQWLGGAPLPSRYTLRWYDYLFRYENGLAALGQSVRFALAAAGLTTLAGVPAAYALARYRFPGRDAIEALFLAKGATPVILIAVGTAALFYRWGLADTFLGVTLAHSVGALPLVLRGTTAAFEQLDPSQEHAARDLGASWLRRIVTIVLPQAVPGIAGAAALAFLFSMDEFTVTFLISGVRYSTLPLRLYSALSQGYIEPAAAAAVLLLIPSLLYLLALLRIFGPSLLTSAGGE